MFEQRVRAHRESAGRQVVDVAVARGYHPSAIVAEAGIPLRLVFNRHDDDACFERVIFSDPRLDRPLAVTGVTVVDLPSRPPGTVRFTCGMGRYHGTIKFARKRPGAMGPVGGRHPWLILGLVVGIVVVALVVSGALSASTALSVGLIGGMVLMHLGGHGGHGGNGGNGRHGGETAPDHGGEAAPGRGGHGDNGRHGGETATDHDGEAAPGRGGHE